MFPRPVHIAGFGQLPHLRRNTTHDEAEMVREATAMALDDAALSRQDVGFICSGSNDYFQGRPFSFVMALDGVAPWPPKRESHVEMDAAWALYEAVIRLQHGDVDVALVYGFGRSSLAALDAVRNANLDPYFLAPLEVGPGPIAALQARAGLDAGAYTEADIAAVVARRMRHTNRLVPRDDARDVDSLLAAPHAWSPLRAHDAAVETDGAAAIILRVGGGGPRIDGLAHRIDAHQPGARDLVEVRSAALAARAAGVDQGVDVAELHARHAHEELLLARAMGLDDRVRLSPSGGSLAADTPMVSGLVRIGEAAAAIRRGEARRALGHATSGPALQHNLVCVLEEA